MAIAKGCKKIKRNLLIATNAYWTKSYSHTKNILLQLRENNLVACMVSTDAFHEEYVPVDCVEMFLRVCGTLGIPVRVQTHSTKSTFARTNEIVRNLGINKMDSVVLYGASCPVGMAKENIERRDFITKKLNQTLCLYDNILYIT